MGAAVVELDEEELDVEELDDDDVPLEATVEDVVDEVEAVTIEVVVEDVVDVVDVEEPVAIDVVELVVGAVPIEMRLVDFVPPAVFVAATRRVTMQTPRDLAVTMPFARAH